jgi:predicted RNA binding protein YcfA (HicA-like mRNA interferase family)
MPKVPPLRAQEIETILARAGFVLDRQSGHRVWCKGERCTPVPSHPGDVPPGTVRSIIALAGMTVEEFLGYR